MRRSEPAISTRSAAGMLAQRAGDLLGDRQRAREHGSAAPGRRRPRARRAAQQVLLDLGAEAAQLADLALLGRGAQRLQRVDPELVVELPGPLGPKPGQVHHRDQAGRELRAQLDRGRDVAGLVERAQLLLERLADPRHVVTVPSRVIAMIETEASRTALAAVR